MKLATFSLLALMAPPLMAQSLSWSQNQVDMTAQAGSPTAVTAKVRLINNTGVSIPFQLNSSQGWLGMDPMAGTIPASLNLLR